MKYEARKITLRDGRTCTLRSPEKNDAPEMLRYMVQVLGESPYLLATPEEFAAVPIEKEEAFIENGLSDGRSVMITAFDGERIIGTADVRGAGHRLRVSHRCGMGISILKEYWSVGLGSAMMEALIDCARKMGYEQLELEVAAGNRRAIGLYLKYGFKVYGCRPHVIRYADGSYADDYLMYKTL
ncbi:MAG: GNAT family N-acetyltransferase [Clostridia bacterium]|nr:GNAT family N-acetyltransferase [Clostridia bacterium]